VDEHFVEIEDESLGYQTTFSQLNFARTPEIDPFKGNGWKLLEWACHSLSLI